MARIEAALQTDIDRIEKMLDDNREGDDNEHTTSILSQAQARLEGALEDLKRDSITTQYRKIDDATDQLVAFETEANVSRELKAAIQDSRSDLINARKAVR